MSCSIENNGTCTLLDCEDSPLSIGGNVISILTFVVAALATYFAFFLDVKDIPQSADDYNSDIQSLADQLWTIGDIHSQLARLVSNSGLRISDVRLQSRLRQSPAEGLKEAKKFLDDYSAAYQNVFTDYFKEHRWIVRLKWLLLQKRVSRFKQEASGLRNSMTLDLLGVALNLNLNLQKSLQERDAQNKTLSRKIDKLLKLMGDESPSTDEDNHIQEKWNHPDSPSPSVMIDPGAQEPPIFLVSPPPRENTRPKPSPNSSSRSPSPFSERKPMDRSLSP